MKTKFRNGFTLVEMAIVLVIIGFIVAGVMAGESIIQNARIVAVVTDIEEFESATTTFYEKYFSLPGDISDAYAYFDPTASNAICGTNADVNTVAAGCNGDDDNGEINGGIGQSDGGTVQQRVGEPLKAWQHLVLAGLIEGSFTGTLDGTSITVGVNVPKSPLQGGGYIFKNHTTTDLLFGRPGNNIAIGMEDTADRLGNSIFSPQDAIVIDDKMDDGLAQGGEVYATEGADNVAGDCIAIVPGDYDLSKDDTACIMVFWLQH